jgi:GTP-binding protein Era
MTNEMLLEDLPDDHRSGFVTVLGKANVGKSTLINGLVGEKVAIVSPKPQTTRRTLRGILTLPEAQIIFVDTPGMHEPRHKLGEYMVRSATRTIPDADVVLFMVDLSAPPDGDDERLAELIRKRRTGPCILVLNKVDLVSKLEEEERTQAFGRISNCEESVVISATEGRNRDRLLALILDRLPPGPRFYPSDQITDQPLRFLAGELVREQALHHLHQEVPHWIAVVVEEFEERREDLTYIEATVYVAKESQKAIVIGQGGKMLKAIGQAARAEIEGLLDARVYLDLWVKVRKQWIKDEAALRHLGFTSPKGEG